LRALGRSRKLVHTVVVPGIDRNTPIPAFSRGASILLIEDDFAIRRSIAELLSEEGYDVTSAANGREALAVLADPGARPHLIILDLLMPTMNGIEFRIAQTSLARLADVPVLVITASRFLPRELEPLGLPHVLRKPLHLEELLQNVATLTSH